MDIPTNSFVDPIGSNTTRDLFTIIRALDTGIINHEEWIGEVHQSLVCGNDHTNAVDLSDDAHCHCKFGQWLYSPDTESVKGFEHYPAVVDNHRQMHAIARNILLKSESKQDVADGEYKNFVAHVVGFKLDVRNLQYELMSQVCVVDHLTGAWNRYSMYSKLHQEKERQMRSGHACTICMMDIDHFKHVNDEHGHLVGDLVLKSVIDFCSTSLRRYDSIYRYGGEEFLFCLPDAEMAEATVVIERLCASLGQHPIVLPDGKSLTVTASFGIACLQPNISVEESIQAADHALLCAKSRGRNRVCSWEDGLKAFE
jgi:diguanylate cyclase (GGDEF)-like protein